MDQMKPMEAASELYFSLTREDWQAALENNREKWLNKTTPAPTPIQEFGNLEITGLNQAERNVEVRPDGTQVVRQPDGSYAVISPKEGDHATTTFYADYESMKAGKADRTETVYDAGRPDGLWKEVHYADPAKHEGRTSEKSYEGRADGKTSTVSYASRITKDIAYDGHFGLYEVETYDSDKNPQGLKEVRHYNYEANEDHVTTEEDYDPEKNNGIIQKRNGKVVKSVPVKSQPAQETVEE